MATLHLGWIVAARGSFKVSAPAIRGSIWLGFFVFIAGAGNLSAIALIPVNLAILVFYTYPLLTLIMASVVDRRMPRPSDYFAIGLAFTGLSIALEVSLDELDLRGVALAFIGALGAAAHIVAAQRVMLLADYKVVTLHMAASGFLFTGVLMAAGGEIALPSYGLGTALLGLVLLGFCTGMVAMLAAVRLVGPVNTSIVMCLEPPVVITAAYFLLGEEMTAVQLGGAAIVVVGVMIGQRTRRS